MDVNKANSLATKLLRLLVDDGASEGEKRNAQKAIDKLVEKYGIDIESISREDKISVHKFYVHSKFERRLVVQIADKVLNREFCTYDYFNKLSGRRSRSTVGIDCTDEEAVEINIMLDFYKDIWYNVDMPLFEKSFIYKHNLYGDYDHGDEDTSKSSVEESLKIYSMMQGMSDKDYQRHKLLESGE